MKQELTFTCMHCSAQHTAEDDCSPGSVQKSRVKWCENCKNSTFHFAAKTSGLAAVQKNDVLRDLKQCARAPRR